MLIIRASLEVAHFSLLHSLAIFSLSFLPHLSPLRLAKAAVIDRGAGPSMTESEQGLLLRKCSQRSAPKKPLSGSTNKNCGDGASECTIVESLQFPGGRMGILRWKEDVAVTNPDSIKLRHNIFMCGLRRDGDWHTTRKPRAHTQTMTRLCRSKTRFST